MKEQNKDVRQDKQLEAQMVQQEEQQQ